MRQAFIRVERGRRDYVTIPEVVDDLCEGINTQFHRDSRERLLAGTPSYLVAFRGSQSPPIDALDTALNYIYESAHHLLTAAWPDTCFDGKGVAVPAFDILSVEPSPGRV